MRDSSPPDATRASGPSGCFACAAMRNSSASRPCAAGAASGSSAISSRPPAIASVRIAAVTRCSSSLAAKRRFARSSLRQREEVRPRPPSRVRVERVDVGSTRRAAASAASVDARSSGERVGPDAVLARDVVQRGEPLVDARELGGIEVEPAAVVAQRARRFVELRLRGLEQRGDLGERRDRARRPRAAASRAARRGA